MESIFNREQMIEIEVNNMFRQKHNGLLPDDMLRFCKIDRKEHHRLTKILEKQIVEAIKA